MGIQVKKKICKSCEKETYIWSKGRCKPCAAQDSYASKKTTKKTCIRCEEQKYIYAKKMCQYCYNVNLANKSKKASSIARTPTKRNTIARKKERAVMMIFWESMEDYAGNVHCEECLLEGKSEGQSCIGATFNPFNCAHILGKGADCSNRDNVGNFLMLCPDHHQMFDGQVNGKTKKEMLVWPKAKEIIIRLKNKDING